MPQAAQLMVPIILNIAECVYTQCKNVYGLKITLACCYISCQCYSILEYMKYYKLKRKTAIGSLVLVKNEECDGIMDNDFYLMNEGEVIRKEYIEENDPEYITLLDADQSFVGLFKHVNKSNINDRNLKIENSGVACWYKLFSNVNQTE